MAKKENKGQRMRSELEDTLGDLLDDDNLLNDISDSGNLPKVHAPEQHDYVKIKGDASERARKTVTSLMKFYLSEDIIDSDEYIKAKKKIDEMTLSSLIYQLEVGERALTTLLRTIDSGELSPRMFEVLATLQKSMLDIIKSQTMYLMAAEEGAKKISRDAEVYKGLKRNTGLPQSTEGGPSNVNMGTKNLMQSIQEEIKAEKANEEPAEEVTSETINLDEMSDITAAETIIEELDEEDELRNTFNEDDDEA